MMKLILASCAFAVWFVPTIADAELLCQQRKSKRIILAEVCPRKFHPIFDLGPVSALNGQMDALKTALDGDIAALTTDLNQRTVAVSGTISGLESDIDEVRGLATTVKPIAANAVTAAAIAADAVDGTKVKKNSLALDDMAPSLMLPFPSNVVGSHGRIVSADLDMSTADGNDVGVVDQEGQSWLRLFTVDEESATAYFVIDPDVFEETPRCIAGVTDSGPADVVRSLGLQVGEDDAGRFIRVRVTGQNRQLDVTGTVICTGPAKL